MAPHRSLQVACNPRCRLPIRSMLRQAAASAHGKTVLTLGTFGDRISLITRVRSIFRIEIHIRYISFNARALCCGGCGPQASAVLFVLICFCKGSSLCLHQKRNACYVLVALCSLISLLISEQGIETMKLHKALSACIHAPGSRNEYQALWTP